MLSSIIRSYFPQPDKQERCFGTRTDNMKMTCLDTKFEVNARERFENSERLLTSLETARNSHTSGTNNDYHYLSIPHAGHRPEMQ